MFLTLPRIAASVPPSFVFGGLSERTARLASIMVDEGLITEDDVASLPAPLKFQAVREVVEKVWKRILGQRMSFGVLSNYSFLVLDAGDPRYYGSPLDTNMVELSFHAAQPEELYAEKVMTALEAHRAGLGCYSLSVLDRALGLFGVPLTPCGVFTMAQYTYWQGEEDETVVMEELAEMGEPTDDVVKRDVLFDGIPAWTYDLSHSTVRPLKRDQVETIAQRLGKPVLADFLKHIIALDKMLEEGNASNLLPDDNQDEQEFETVEYMAMVRWNEDDQLTRVIDDQYHYAVQGETRDGLGQFRFPATAEGLRTGLSRLNALLDIFRTLDCALVTLKEY